jgi:hypothetical protein
MRPYYWLASDPVHANPKGLSFNLGLHPFRKGSTLGGPSNVGLADPGHATAVSLLQLMTTFLALRPGVDAIITMHLLRMMSDDIGEAFVRAKKALDAKIAAFERSPRAKPASRRRRRR